MVARPPPGPNGPRSIKEITASAENFDFNPNVAFKFWIRSASILFQEASFAIQEGDFAKAYLMLYRHCFLVINHLRTHPGFKDPENKRLYRPLEQNIPKVMIELERLKPMIKEEYDEWQRLMPSDHMGVDHSRRPSTYEEYAARDPSLGGNAKVLDAAEHQDLAVDLAQQALRKRDAAKRATRRAGISEEEETERRKAGAWDLWGSPVGKDSRLADDEDLRRQMEATRRNLDSVREQRPEESLSRRDRPSAAQRSSSHGYHYPSTYKSQPVDYHPDEAKSPRSLTPQPPRPPKELSNQTVGYFDIERTTTPPVVPRKVGREPEQHTYSHPFQLPPLPRKEPLPRESPPPPYSEPPPYPQSDAEATPMVPPKQLESVPPLPKKERLTFRPAAYLENGDPIRSVFLPSRLRKSFLEIAADNTAKGLEMCGLLCGTPVNNALFVTCLVIPEQKCTPDTCETTNESGTLDFCINEDLLVLGWIHTHPTQTCFMSSRDLHTQAGYQVMMPESIAIVCAPKYEPSYGIFRLTNPPGLTHILQCSHTETFHQHSIDNIYTEAEHPPGHVYESSKLDFRITDLRR